RLMLVMVVFFIAFRWIHLSTPLIRLFLLVLILLLMPTLNFLPVWFALSLLRFRLPSRLPMMFILIFKLAPSVCRMTFPILASLLVRLVVLLPFQLLRLSLATPSRWTPLALSVFLHCVVAL